MEKTTEFYFVKSSSTNKGHFNLTIFSHAELLKLSIKLSPLNGLVSHL